MHCQVRVGAVGGRGRRRLPLPGPVGSCLELVPLVSCNHLCRVPERGHFHCYSRPDPLGEVCQAVPAGAQQPCREPTQEALPTMSPSASPAPLTPLASILAADPQDQCNIKTVLQGPAAKTSSPPGNSFWASAIPAIWVLASLAVPCHSCRAGGRPPRPCSSPPRPSGRPSKSPPQQRKPPTGKAPQTAGQRRAAPHLSARLARGCWTSSSPRGWT